MRLTVVGGGPAGYVSALTARRLGADVFLIEKEDLGGTCLNKGCIPTKTLIHSLEILNKFKNQKYNQENTQLEIAIDLPTLMQRKDNVVETQKRALATLLKQSGVKIIKSDTTLITPKTLFLKDTSEKIETQRLIIATGSRPAELPMLKFDGEKILSSDDLWNLRTIPESIAIIGAGAIGCEFAWIFHLLGSKVYILELMPRALPMEDEEISKAVERLFKKKKIEFYSEVKITDLKHVDNSVELSLSNGKTVHTDIVLVSVGRAYNTEFLIDSEIKLGTKKKLS